MATSTTFVGRRAEHDAPGVSGSILEGLDEILTVIRLGLPPQLRHSLACTNAIENAIGTVRTVQRNVKRWRNAEMALRWTAAGLLERRQGRGAGGRQINHCPATASFCHNGPCAKQTVP